MENLLLKKLKIKSGNTVEVRNAPNNFSDIIGAHKEGINFIIDSRNRFDALLIFATNKVEMNMALKDYIKNIDANLICWILYPKAKTKLASDLNLMQSWDDLKTYQLTPCASAAVNEIWTAIRIKPVLASKKSGLGNQEIKQNDYGNYIDVAKKTIHFPTDLKVELNKNTAALSYYETLSYSNRKEYVLWILSAKQEKTRIDRILKTVHKLLQGKKNPSEK